MVTLVLALPYFTLKLLDYLNKCFRAVFWCSSGKKTAKFRNFDKYRSTRRFLIAGRNYEIVDANNVVSVVIFR